MLQIAGGLRYIKKIPRKLMRCTQAIANVTESIESTKVFATELKSSIKLNIRR
jgi:hypothetical protein